MSNNNTKGSYDLSLRPPDQVLDDQDGQQQQHQYGCTHGMATNVYNPGFPGAYHKHTAPYNTFQQYDTTYGQYTGGFSNSVATPIAVYNAPYNSMLSSSLAAGSGIKRHQSVENQVRAEGSGSVKKKPKVAALELQADDTAPKLGERMVHTTQPRYHQYRRAFGCLGEAQSHLRQVQWTTQAEPDPTFQLPVADADKEHYVIQIYNALVDTTSGFYDKISGHSQNRVLNEKYEQDHIEAMAWLIVEEAINLHRYGCTLYKFADPTWKVTAGKVKFEEDRNLLFNQRIDAICEAFRTFKSICTEALDSDKFFKVVYAPRVILQRTRNNAVSNDRRATNAKKGRTSAMYDAREDSEAPLVDGSALHMRYSPIFADSTHQSFAQSQDVSPTNAENLRDPPRTPTNPGRMAQGSMYGSPVGMMQYNGTPSSVARNPSRLPPHTPRNYGRQF